MLTSAQIIARSQAEVASKLNSLLQYLPDSPTVLSTEVSPFGANQFLILVTWNATAGMRAFAVTSFAGLRPFMFRGMAKKPAALLGAKAKIVKGWGRTKKPLLGFLATVSLLYKELFVLQPLLGLKANLKKSVAKSPNKLLLGMKVLPAKYKNGSIITPF
jgi:hypothetical protein